jgi:predicted kinase
MVGCQGSGKSTWSRKNVPNGAICSADDYFNEGGKYNFDPSKLGKAHSTCFRTAVEACKSGQDIVIDNTNSTVLEIAPYYALAKSYDYDVVLVHFHVDPEIAYKRNQHGVPLEGVRNTAERCERLNIPPFWEVSHINA